MIDTDTRQLKRLGSGAYSTGAGKHICDHCGINDTCQVTPSANTCQLFLPALPFQDETGLDRPSNTVRVGVAWTKRLQVGQTIALYNARTKKVFGHAKVTQLEAGGIVEMLRAHARNNHLMLDTDPKRAPAELYKWQKQNYGPRIIHEETKITAIYLQRLGVEDAPTDHGEDEARRSAEGCAPRAGEDHGDGSRHPVHHH